MRAHSLLIVLSLFGANAFAAAIPGKLKIHECLFSPLLLLLTEEGFDRGLNVRDEAFGYYQSHQQYDSKTKRDDEAALGDYHIQKSYDGHAIAKRDNEAALGTYEIHKSYDEKTESDDDGALPIAKRDGEAALGNYEVHKTYDAPHPIAKRDNEAALGSYDIHKSYD